MNFYEVLGIDENSDIDQSYNPYAAKTEDGEWIEGLMSVDWLNTHFGECNNATDMIEKAESYNLDSTILYFEWLVEQGKLEM